MIEDLFIFTRNVIDCLLFSVNVNLFFEFFVNHTEMGNYFV